MKDLWLVLSLFVIACGPAVPSDEDGSTSSSGDGSTSELPPASTGSDPVTTTSGVPTTTGSNPTSGSTTDASDSSSDGGTTMGPDVTPVPGECDVWAQDCPEGEKCSAYATDEGNAWNAVACFPVVPTPDAPGEPCVAESSGTSGFDSCALGSMCWSVNEALEGTCIALCTGSALEPTCASSEQTCSIANDGVLNVCLQTCDPDDADPCPEGEQCFPLEGAWVCAPGVDQGPETCDVSNCSPGTVCVAPDVFGQGCDAQVGCCTDYCDLNTPECAMPQQTCVALYPEDPPAGFEDVGACVLP